MASKVMCIVALSFMIPSRFKDIYVMPACIIALSSVLSSLPFVMSTKNIVSKLSTVTYSVPEFVGGTSIEPGLILDENNLYVTGLPVIWWLVLFGVKPVGCFPDPLKKL